MEPESYDVEVQGRTIRRNRCHLRKLIPTTVVELSEDTDETDYEEERQEEVKWEETDEEESEEDVEESVEEDEENIVGEEEIVVREDNSQRPSRREGNGFIPREIENRQRSGNKRNVSRRHLNPDCVYY